MFKETDIRNMADNYDEYVINEMRNALGPEDDSSEEYLDKKIQPEIDMKEHADLLKALVSQENEKDENWKWSVKSVGKAIAHIAWSYLDYCGGYDGKKTFTITAKVDETFGNTLTARHPFGEIITFTAIGGRFKDVDTAEEGIKRMVFAIASCAHSQY